MVHVTTPADLALPAGHGRARRRRPRHRREAGDLDLRGAGNAGPARPGGRPHLVEDYNYLFNDAPRRSSTLIESGEFGSGDARRGLHLPRHPRPERLRRPQRAPPRLSMAGGAIADFLTHLASLAHLFVGPHRIAETGLVEAQTLAPAVRRVPGPGGGRARDRGRRLQRQLAARRLLAAGLRGEDAGDRQPVRDPADLRRPPQRPQAAAPVLQRPGRGQGHPPRGARDAAAQVQGARGL